MNYYTERRVKGHGTGGQFRIDQPKAQECLRFILAQPSGTRVSRSDCPCSHHIADGTLTWAVSHGYLEAVQGRRIRTEKGAPSMSTEPRSYTIEKVALGDMFVDRTPGLQRPRQDSWVKSIAAAFSWDKFSLQPVLLSRRADGTHHIMDGQHKVAAAMSSGVPADHVVECYVWQGLTHQQEAEIFYTANHESHSVRALDLFEAAVTAGKPEQVAVREILTRHGWVSGSSGRVGNFAAVTTLLTAYKKSGAAVADRVIRVITQAWAHSADSAQSPVVKVIAAFFAKYPDADPTRLTHVLSKRTPRSILGDTKERAWVALAVLRLQEAYDTGLRSGRLA